VQSLLIEAQLLFDKEEDQEGGQKVEETQEKAQKATTILQFKLFFVVR
jgi:hypothetical protein